MSFDSQQDRPNPYESPTPFNKIADHPTSQSSDERTWAMLCHLGGLAGYAVPFGHLIAPLVIWLIKKDQMPFVDDQGKESLNFQISITIYLAICIPLFFVLIGIPLMVVISVFDVVVIVIAAVKANQGIAYRYPLCIRFVA